MASCCRVSSAKPDEQTECSSSINVKELVIVNQVRKDLACMLGGSGRLFLTACPALLYFAHVCFSQIYAWPE